MSKKEKFFRYFVCNAILCTVIVSVLIFSLGQGVKAASAPAPIYKGNDKSKVSLMINVYWGTEYLDAMLATLENHRVKTTFFVGGMWAAENDEKLTKIYNQGHEIGNHGYYHKDHKKLGEERNREEIYITHQLVKKILGIEMKLFAPPSGSFSKTTLEVAEKLGYKTIMWTQDTIDWRDQDENLIFKRVVNKLEGGALVLMHPTKCTAAVLDRILTAIEEKGLKVSTVSDVLSDISDIVA